MATNITPSDLTPENLELSSGITPSDITPENIDIELNKLFNIQDISQGSSGITPSGITPSDITPNSVDPDYKNSTSNKWDIATDELGANFYSSLGVISAKLGFDKQAQSFRNTAEEYRKEAASKPKPDISMSITEESGKIYDKFSDGDFWGALANTAGFVHSALIGAAPSLAAMGTAVAATPIITTLAGGGVVTGALTATVVGLASGVTLSSGNVYEELIKNGVSKEEAENISLTAGAAIGSLERLGLAHVVKGLVGKLGPDLTVKYLTKNTKLAKKTVQEAVDNAEEITKKSIIAETAKGAVKGGAIEGTTEAAQSVIEEIVPPIAAGKEIEGGKLLKNVVDSFAVGNIAGSFIRGPLQGLSVPVARQALRQSEEDAKVLEELEKASTEIDDVYKQGKISPKQKKSKKPISKQGKIEEQRIAKRAALLEEEEPLITPARPALTEGREQRTGMKTLPENVEALIIEREKLIKLKNKSKKKFSKKNKARLNEITAELQVDRGNKSFNFARDLVSRATTPLRELSNRTSVAKRMVNELQNMPAKHNADVGKFYTIKEDIIQPLLKDFKVPFQSRIDSKLKKQVTDQLNYDDYVASDPRAKKVAEELRSKIFDPLYDTLKASGVDINRVDNYLTRIYKFKVGPGRKKSIQGMIDILNRNGLNGSAIVDNIISNDGVFIPDGDIDILLPDQQSKQMQSSQIDPEKPRSIPTNVVKQLDIAGYLENDFDKITNKYIISALKRADLKRYVDTYNPVINNLYRNGVMNLEEAKRIKDIVDALQFRYNPIQKDSLRRAYRFINTSTYILTLPLAAITALSEPLIVLHRVSPKNALYGAMDAALIALKQGVRTFRPKFSKAENERALMSLMQTADLSLSDAFRDINETSVTKRVTDKFFRINLLAQVTQLSRNIAFQSARRQTAEDIKLLQELEYKGELVKTRKKGQKGEVRMRPRETKKTKRARQRLALQGIRNPVPKINSKTDQFEDITERQQEILNWANSPDLANPPDIITRGLGMVVDEVIMTPNAVNRPLWMSNPHFAPIAQLKGFMMVFGNTVGMRMYKEVFQPLFKGRLPAGDILKYATMFTLLSATILGTQAIKNVIRYGDNSSPYDEDEGWEKLWSAILQSNIFGFGNLFVNAIKAAEYGQDPIISGFLGPAAGKASNIARAIASGDPKRISNAITANLPVLSAFPAVRRKELLGMAEGGSIFDNLFATRPNINRDRKSMRKGLDIVGESLRIKDNYVGDGDDTEAVGDIDNIIFNNFERLGINPDNYGIAKNNLIDFATRTKMAESSGDYEAINIPEKGKKKTTAKGAYQFIDGSVLPALKRLEVRIGKRDWIDRAKQHKDIFKLTPLQQDALFLGDIMEKTIKKTKGLGDKYIKRILKGDVKAMKDLYRIGHHTVGRKGMSPAARKNMNRWFQ